MTESVAGAPRANAPSDGAPPTSEPRRRGRLRVYVAVAPGAGATCALLDEATRRAERGATVLVGPVSTHGRAVTTARLDTLRRLAEPLAEPLAEVPAGNEPTLPPGAVVVVDDLADRTEDGQTRWQLAERLVRTGNDVIASVSIGAVASLADLATTITGRPSNGTVPDRVLKQADQLELVDITPDALRRRLAHGNLVEAHLLDAGTAAAYEPERLARLRELAIEWMADRVEDDANRVRRHPAVAAAADEDTPAVAVALDGRGGDDAAVRRAARLADRLGARLVAIELFDTGPSASDAHDASHALRRSDAAGTGGTTAAAARRLVADLGGEVRTAAGDRSDALVAAAAAARAGQLVVCSGRTLPRRLLRAAADAGIDLHVVPLADHRPVRRWSPAKRWAVAAVAALVMFALLVPLSHDDRIALASLVVATSSAIAAAVVARRSRATAARAQAHAAALTASARTLITDPHPVAALLNEARHALGLAGVALVAPSPEGRVIEQAVGVPVSIDEASAAADVGTRGRVLLAAGRTLDQRELRLLRGFAAQVAAAGEHQVLHADAAAAELLAETDALRTSILRAVSHDLHTPIAGIKASVTSLRQDDVTFTAEARRELLATIDTEADRLHRMVTNLLDVSRLQAGAVTVDKRPIYLEDVVAATLANVAHRQDRIEVSVPETLPPALADSALLERALANLVTNALAWSPREVAVRIDAAIAGGPHGDELRLRVIDHGPGIAPDQRERVLQPFQRIGRKSLQAGAGLGLTVVAGFVDALGARLLLDDTPGGGLTATVVLASAAG